jgi:haloacetate dehalogenase
LLDGFSDARIEVGDGVAIRTRVAGDGPPLLLLHGYPQTHACWHRVAPRLVAAGFTVVLTDLRGYGDSSKPASTPDHAPYAKRAMAADQVAVMRALGHARFAVAGHDRGGRVAHRMALDHAQAVARIAVLDIAPTATMYARTDRAFATGYYHWFFLIQPAPLPERLIGAEPELYLRAKLAAWNRGEDTFAPAAVAEYLRCFADPATIAATCEDYRAAATVDLEHDAADAVRRIEAPLLALWGARGLVGRSYDVLATWRDKATDVRGHALPTGHYLPEEAPEAVAQALAGFFTEP